MKLLAGLGIDVRVVAPLGASAADLARLPEADFNVALYPEISLTTAKWLERNFGQKLVDVQPIGTTGTRAFIAAVTAAAFGAAAASSDPADARMGWYARSVDSTYLTGKRVFVFGDATHAVAAARIARDELGFAVVGIGTYVREFAREVRAAAAEHGVEALITDDYLEVEARIEALRPELVLGTQMDGASPRQAARRSLRGHLGAGPRPGFPGALLAADGLRRRQRDLRHVGAPADDGARGAPPRHVPGRPRILGRRGAVPPRRDRGRARDPTRACGARLERGGRTRAEKDPLLRARQARRNTESFARDRGAAVITLETLYDAKAHFGR